MSEQEKLRKASGFRNQRLRRSLLLAAGFRGRPSRKQKFIWALIIFLISFSTKSLMALDLFPVLSTNAQAAGRWEFEQDAAAIAAGHGMLFRDDWDRSDTRLLFHAPGYAIFLSGVYRLFGRSPLQVQLLQNLINSASAILLFLIAGTLLTWRIGAVSGLLVAVSHHLSYYSNFLLPDSLSALPILIAIYLLDKFRHGSKRFILLYIFVGLMIGLCTWLRPNAMLLGPFLTIAVACVLARRFRALRWSWIIAVVSFLVITPITIRNYVIYRQFVPVSANFGIVLWEGIGDASGDRFGAVTTDQAVAEQEAVLYDRAEYGAYWASPDGIQRDRDRVRRSLSVISQHPAWFVRTMANRMTEMVKYSAHAPLVYRECSQLSRKENSDTQNAEGPAHDKELLEQEETGDSTVLSVAEHLCWLRSPIRALQRLTKETAQPFIFIGVLLLSAVSLRRTVFLLIIPLYFFITQSIGHLEFRYTIPMHYFLFVFAATTWVILATQLYKLAIRMVKQ